MPITWTADLAEPPEAGERLYDDLHRIACRFFEPDGADHRAEDKPFAIRLASANGTGNSARLTYTWLADAPPPCHTPPDAVRIGGLDLPAAGRRTAPVPYQRIEQAAPMRRATLSVITPAKFRHYSRDYPLPDPYVTFDSLARRYLRFRPAVATTAETRALARAVVVYAHDIHTERFTWHGRDSAGFVGTVEFGIPRATGESMWRLFGTLCRFAALAGLGHGTTHGLGATDLRPTTARTRADPPLTPPGSAIRTGDPDTGATATDDRRDQPDYRV